MSRCNSKNLTSLDLLNVIMTLLSAMIIMRLVLRNRPFLNLGEACFTCTVWFQLPPCSLMNREGVFYVWNKLCCQEWICVAFCFLFLIYKDIPLFLGLYLNVSGFDIETAKAWFPLLRLFVTCGNFVHLPYLSSS